MDNDISIAFGENLKKIRYDEGLTQREVADAIGVTPASLSAYEKGTQLPSITVATKTALFFNVSLDWLFGIDKELKPFGNVFNTEQLLRSFIAIAKNPNLISLYLPGEIENYEFSQLRVIYPPLDDFLEQYSHIFDLYNADAIDKEIFHDLIDSIIHKYAQVIYFAAKQPRFPESQSESE